MCYHGISKYLIVNLVFSHLGYMEWESFSDCIFSCSLPSCTYSIAKHIKINLVSNDRVVGHFCFSYTMTWPVTWL